MFSKEILSREGRIMPQMGSERCNKTHETEIKSKLLNLQFSDSTNYSIMEHIDSTERSFKADSKDGPILFPLQTVLPKVQMLKLTEKKKCPKDVAVERRYREYARTDLVKELRKVGIFKEDLHPTDDQFKFMSDISFTHFFPLSFFDDTRFETRSVKAWLSLSNLEEAQMEGVPARAYVPIEKSLLQYDWGIVSVIDFDYKTSLWKVISLLDMNEYMIPNTQLVFIAEDPMNFVKRLKKAHRQRKLAESRVRIFLMIDMCLIFDARELHFKGQKRIDAILSSANTSIDCAEQLREEVGRIFKRVMGIYDIDAYLKEFPDDLPAFKNMVTKDLLPKLPKQKFRIPKIQYSIRIRRFIRKIMNLNRKSLYYNVAAYEAMQSVVNSCHEVEKLNLFVVTITKPLPLVDFVSGVSAHNQSTANYLTKTWPTRIASNIILTLRPEGKGFLDVSLNKYIIYVMCKVALLIYQVKLRMEDSIHTLLITSIEHFINTLTRPCTGFIDVPSDFVWENNFIESHFPWKSPIFYLVLSINDSRSAIYSTEPEEFAPILSDIFKKGLERSAAIRCIDAETMTNLTFDPKSFIKTVEFVDDLFTERNAYLKRCYLQACIPLRAYANTYNQFVDFYLKNVSFYMREYAEAHKPSTEVKADIIEHTEQIEYLKENLPDSLNIGPFQINVQQIKQYLIDKHADIKKKIIDYYVDRMFESSEILLEEGTEMFNTINDRPISIEHLIDIREFAAALPETLDAFKGDIQVMILEYDVLDTFFINVSDAQFTMKWDVIAWPNKILKRMATLRDEQKIDFDDFQRLHQSECSAFEDRLGSLNEEVHNYSFQHDPNKVMEMYTEVKKTLKNIGDASDAADVLQKRQKLFELPPLDLTFLSKIKTAFVPYKNLWTAGAEAHKLQDATVGNPMTMVELKEVWKSVNELRLQLVEVSKEFEDKAELQLVALTFTRYLKSFKPILESLRFLKNENWLMLHWQELNAVTGLDFKYSPALNFLSLMKKGIMDHLDTIKEIGTRAIEDADEIRRRLEEEERLRQEEALRILLLKESRKCRRDIL